MGMSASQVRLLSMTARVHDIENEAQRIQNQKMMLANQSDEAYEEYLNALEQKNIQAMHFNPATGTFDWDEVGIEGLYDNGYALKIKGTKTNSILTTAASSSVNLQNDTLGAVINVAIHEQYESNFVENTNNNIAATNSYYSVLTDPTSTIGTVNDLIPVPGGTQTDNNTSDYNVITISSAQDLIDLAQFANGASTHANLLMNKTFILTQDINFDQQQAASYAHYINMAPSSGSGYTLRNATFLGNGHTISGLTCSLFTSIDSDVNNPDAHTVIQDIKLENCVLDDSNDAAALAKIAYGNIDIDNCYVTNSAIGELNAQTANAGGLIAEIYSYSGTPNNITINNSAIDSNVRIYGEQTCGGYIGKINYDGTINITNSGSSASLETINIQNSYTGGFVGLSASAADLNITNSYESYISSSYDSNNNYAMVGYGSADLTDCALPGDNDGIAYHGNLTQCGNVYSVDITITAGSGTKTYTYDDPNMNISDICEDLEEKLKEDFHDPSIKVSATTQGLKIEGDFANISGIDISNTDGNYFNVASTFGCPGSTTQAEETSWTYCRSWQDVFTALGTSVGFDCPALLRELLANAMAIVCTYTEDPEELDENNLPKRYYTETSVSVDTHLREAQNDKDMAKAEANYESALRKIDQKDQKYDKELAALDNERKAVTEQMETFKKCIQENIDRTMKVFNG